MKQKLFEWVGGNGFKIATEGTHDDFLRATRNRQPNNPEEQIEIQIARGILRSAQYVKTALSKVKVTDPNVESELSNIALYVIELLKMHGTQ